MYGTDGLTTKFRMYTHDLAIKGKTYEYINTSKYSNLIG